MITHLQSMLTVHLSLIELTTCWKEILVLENDTSMEKLEKEFIYILNYDLMHVNCVLVFIKKTKF